MAKNTFSTRYSIHTKDRLTERKKNYSLVSKCAFLLLLLFDLNDFAGSYATADKMLLQLAVIESNRALQFFIP